MGLAPAIEIRRSENCKTPAASVVGVRIRDRSVMTIGGETTAIHVSFHRPANRVLNHDICQATVINLKSPPLEYATLTE